MADEKKTDQAKADDKLLATSPQIAEWMATLVNEQILKTLNTDVAEKLAQARQAVDAKKAITALSQQDQPTGKRKMDQAQVGEWFRCALIRMRGSHVEPNPDLDADGIITQSLAESVGTAGGYLVPDEFAAELHKRADEKVVVWPLLTRRPTSRDQVTSVEVTTYVTPSKGTAAKSTSATTADEVTVTEPVFGEVTWNLRAIDARVPIKLNLLDDSPLNVLEQVVALVADGFATHRETLPLTGGGAASTEPVGLLNAEAGITTASVTNVTSVANILGFLDELPARYRGLPNLALLAGSTLYFSIVSTLAQNIRAAQYMMGVLPKMLEASHMSAGKLLYGDFSRYVVYYNPMMKMVSSTVAERWTLELVFQERWDGQVPIADAFRIGNVSSY